MHTLVVVMQMLGAWAAYTWAQLGKPPRLLLVEMGPGRGTLAADMLRATAGVTCQCGDHVRAWLLVSSLLHQTLIL